MNVCQEFSSDQRRQRGNTLVLVSASLVVLLGMAGLAIDLVSLYVARSEAQRAADAAALAGAKWFVTSGCTSAAGGCVDGGPQEGPAREQAIIAGTQNSVAGQSPTILDSDVKFNYPTPENPTITVTVARDATHGEPVPTFFMRIFGVTARAVSATATAEAFNPSGSNILVATQCLKPWLLPNCDWNHMVPEGNSNGNPNCPDDPNNPKNYASYYIVGSGEDSKILNPGPVSSGGVVGQEIVIKPGQPSEAPAPSKFYPVFLPPGETAALCPDCAKTSNCTAPNSAACYEQNIACCSQNPVTCGLTKVETINGNMVQGPTGSGVDCLIHEDNKSDPGGQDILVDPSAPNPYKAGWKNPYVPKDTPLTFSDSVVTVPVYEGTALSPGNSNPSQVNVDVIGFMQIFVKEEAPKQATVTAYILNIGACGGGGGGPEPPPGGGGGTISSGGASPIPVRLIHN